MDGSASAKLINCRASLPPGTEKLGPSIDFLSAVPLLAAIVAQETNQAAHGEQASKLHLRRLGSITTQTCHSVSFDWIILVINLRGIVVFSFF